MAWYKPTLKTNNSVIQQKLLTCFYLGIQHIFKEVILFLLKAVIYFFIFESHQSLPLNSLDLDAFDAEVSQELVLIGSATLGHGDGSRPHHIVNFVSLRHDAQSAFEESFWRSSTIWRG